MLKYFQDTLYYSLNIIA